MSRIIHTVGNMVKIPDIGSIASHESDNNIIFVGKMSYEPNIVAVTFFSTKIFPVLKESYPDLEFKIIGANPGSRVKKFSEIDGITVTGFVDSVEPYFRNATIVVAPMLTGAGIQNKIIQAMSYGCCVVTTSIGAEGLTIENNEIAILNNKEEWISELTALLANKEHRKGMGVRARKYVQNNLSKDVVAKQFWAFINSAITNDV
ncbi:MAG: glycosyltransferase family 4 protein [Muribaculaceae bacterium]|jgi:Glycosyltransferase